MLKYKSSLLLVPRYSTLGVVTELPPTDHELAAGRLTVLLSGPTDNTVPVTLKEGAIETQLDEENL